MVFESGFILDKARYFYSCGPQQGKYIYCLCFTLCSKGKKKKSLEGEGLFLSCMPKGDQSLVNQHFLSILEMSKAMK